MPNKRDLKLDKYNIDKYQYRELHNFCLQYSKKKQKADSLLGAKGVAYTGMPGSAEPGNPTASTAEKREKDLQDCRLIEETIREIDDIWYDQLLLGITKDLPWRYLRLKKDLGMNEKEYAEKRRKFYYLLAVKKKLV